MAASNSDHGRKSEAGLWELKERGNLREMESAAIETPAPSEQPTAAVSPNSKLIGELHLLMKELDKLDDPPEPVVEARVAEVEARYQELIEQLRRKHRSGLSRIKVAILGHRSEEKALRDLSEEREAAIARVTRIHGMFEASSHQKVQERAKAVFIEWTKPKPKAKVARRRK
jgi:hypothetical protein